MAETDARRTAAGAATAVAALHVLYAASGGVAGSLGSRWALALATVAGAALCWSAARRGPWSMAWAGVALLVLPAALAWPEIGVSVGGLLALAALAITVLLVAYASLPPKAAPA